MGVEIIPLSGQSHHLSLGAFVAPPKEILEFKVGDKITRENFTSLLIQSFSISRG